MSEQERPLKGLHDAVTGKLTMVPVDDSEWDEIKAKQARVQTEQEAAAAAEVAKQADADSLKEVIAALPSDDEIKSAKSTDLKDLILRQNAAINAILKKLGMTE